MRIEYKYCPNLTIIDTPGASPGCCCSSLHSWTWREQRQNRQGPDGGRGAQRLMNSRQLTRHEIENETLTTHLSPPPPSPRRAQA